MKTSPEGQNRFKLVKKKRTSKLKTGNVKNRRRKEEDLTELQGAVTIIQQTYTGEKQKKC